MDFALLFLAWIAGMIAVPTIAEARGRNGAGYLLLAFVSTPLFAWAVLVSLPDLATDKQRRQEHRELLEVLARALPAPAVAPPPPPVLTQEVVTEPATHTVSAPSNGSWPGSRLGIEWPVGIVIVAVLVAIAWAGAHGR